MVTADRTSVSDDETSLRSEWSFSYAVILMLTHISDKCGVFGVGWWLGALIIESVLLLPQELPPPTPSLVRIPISLPARVEN